MKYSEMIAETEVQADEDLYEIGHFLEQSGMTDDAIDAYFLAHYGKKGMKWGQRKLTYQKIIAARRTPTKSQLVRSSQNTNRRVATVGVAALGIGAAFAAKRFGYKPPKMKAIALSTTAAFAVNRLIKAHQNKKMSEISFTERSKP